MVIGPFDISAQAYPMAVKQLWRFGPLQEYVTVRMTLRLQALFAAPNVASILLHPIARREDKIR
jgi:hypothetical protein